MSRAKPRRHRRPRQFSLAEELRKLEAREPVFTVFAKRLGRRKVQQYMFGSDAAKAEARRRAENEAGQERAKAEVVMAGIAAPEGGVEWSAIIEPWKSRSERRVRRVVQWRADGHMVSRLEDVPTILVEGRFRHLLETSPCLRDLERWPGAVAHGVLGACWWLLNETTRGLPGIVAAEAKRATSADRVRRLRERQRGRGSMVVVGAELLGYTMPATLRQSGPSIARSPELLSRRVFQAIVSEIFRKTSVGFRHSKGKRCWTLVHALTDECSAIRKVESLETVQREFRKQQTRILDSVLTVLGRVHMLVMDALSEGQPPSQMPEINWSRLNREWEVVVAYR
jgi:hypothetical protein